MPRKRREIDLETVKKLASIQCTIREIAYFLNVPESTLKSRKDVMMEYYKGLEIGKISLRRRQFELANNNVAMSIWLGKQYLGQSEPTINLGLISQPLPEFENMSDEELVKLIKEKIEKIKNEQEES